MALATLRICASGREMPRCSRIASSSAIASAPHSATTSEPSWADSRATSGAGAELISTAPTTFLPATTGSCTEAPKVPACMKGLASGSCSTQSARTLPLAKRAATAPCSLNRQADPIWSSPANALRFSSAVRSSWNSSAALLRLPIRVATDCISFWVAARVRTISVANNVTPAASTASALVDRITVSSCLRSE